MDLVKNIKLWRGIGQILNTKIGSSISHAIGQPVNWMLSQAVSTNNDDIPWTPFKKPLTESCLAFYKPSNIRETFSTTSCFC